MSFIDNNDVLKLLSYRFFCDVSDSNIFYNPKPSDIYLNQVNNASYLVINPSDIVGPVSTYNISLSLLPNKL